MLRNRCTDLANTMGENVIVLTRFYLFVYLFVYFCSCALFSTSKHLRDINAHNIFFFFQFTLLVGFTGHGRKFILRKVRVLTKKTVLRQCEKFALHELSPFPCALDSYSGVRSHSCIPAQQPEYYSVDLASCDLRVVSTQRASRLAQSGKDDKQ